MEKVKALFSAKTAKGRMVRSFLQTIGAGLALLTVVVLAPEFKRFLDMLGLGGWIGAIASFVAAASGVWSVVEKWYYKLAAWAES
jgi:hypothetical protein